MRVSCYGQNAMMLPEMTCRAGSALRIGRLSNSPFASKDGPDLHKGSPISVSVTMELHSIV